MSLQAAFFRGRVLRFREWPPPLGERRGPRCVQSASTHWQQLDDDVDVAAQCSELFSHVKCLGLTGIPGSVGSPTALRSEFEISVSVFIY